MKFFIIVSFIMANTAALDRPLYVFAKPNFETVRECREFVSVMHQRIYSAASASYNHKYTPESIYCITKDEVKDIFKYSYDQKEKTNI
tara:strand:+ start:85 stop:348 length:264 start_codon:yes stop_codon:yes gene_type:complete